MPYSIKLIKIAEQHFVCLVNLPRRSSPLMCYLILHISSDLTFIADTLWSANSTVTDRMGLDHPLNLVVAVVLGVP